MKVFNAFVLPHFLYDSETWNMTDTQQSTLEVAYNSCFQGILGVRVLDWHNFKRIHNTCGAKSLAMLMA
jgi:hypothetical protein